VKYKLSRKASDVVDEIILYTDEHFGPEQTEDYVGGLIASFDLLAQNPLMGKAIRASEARRYIYRAHYVLYRVFDDHVFITDIRNTRQELPKDWEA